MHWDDEKTCYVNAEGWICINVPDAFIGEAMAMRAERDRKYKSIYEVKETDERWVGDLGEIVLNSWFKHNDVKDYKWITEDAAGKPDFITSQGKTVDAKTVKRKDAPRAGYTAQITACHIDEPVDGFFFMSFDYNKKQMWLLGGISKKVFKRKAKFYGAGEKVHPNYIVREKHGILNIGATELIRPEAWVKAIKEY